jgi:hypothetical protein
MKRTITITTKNELKPSHTEFLAISLDIVLAHFDRRRHVKVLLETPNRRIVHNGGEIERREHFHALLPAA